MSRLSRRYAVIGLALLVVAIVVGQWYPAVPDFLRGILYGVAIGCLLGAIMKARAPDACDTDTPEQRRRYLREFLPAVALYMVAILASVSLLKRIDEPVLRAMVALMPVPPIAFAMRAMVRRIRAAD